MGNAVMIVGGDVRADSAADADAIRRIRESIGRFLQVKHLAVLVGAGASFHLGSPAIRQVPIDDLLELLSSGSTALEPEGAEALRGLVPDDGVNLEDLLARLTAALRYGETFDLEDLGGTHLTTDLVRRLVSALNGGLVRACDLPQGGAAIDERFRTDPWLAHREFFRRLLRSRRVDLPRVRLFTTNYDLVIEKTFDDAGFPYFDGFGGTVARTMRLETFEQDLYVPPREVDRRLTRVENVVYLYKVHGSINWRSAALPSGGGTREVVQVSDPSAWRADDLALIFPTPHKEAEVLGYPYADLLRVLSTTLATPETALLLIGYGLGDEHLNRLIFRALASSPTFQLLLVDPFGVIDASGSNDPPQFRDTAAGRLAQLNDQRISVITGSAACFADFGLELMPDPEESLGEPGAVDVEAIEKALLGPADDPEEADG